MNLIVIRVPSKPVGFVYLWTNIINGKKYIGSHIGNTDDGYQGSGKLFRRAVEKHGIENFKRTILESCHSIDTTRQAEERLIKEHNAAHSDEYYNLRSTVGGGFEYINNHPERDSIIDKIRTKAKSRLANSDNHPRGMKGKSHSDETKAQISISTQTSMIKLIGKSVYQFDLLTGSLIKKYDTITEAARSVNGCPSNIKYTCEGKFEFAYGFLWSYDLNPPKIDIFKSKKLKKKIITPYGEFTSFTLAARKERKRYTYIVDKIKSKTPGYSLEIY